MPEFVLDKGAQSARFAGLDAFTQGYIEAMFFTFDEAAGLDDLSSWAWDCIREDCRAFQEGAARSLELAYDYAPVEYDAHGAGRDFWYSRNGHGVGFWDRGLGRVGHILADDARGYGECSLYRGDDGELYLA